MRLQRACVPSGLAGLRDPEGLKAKLKTALSLVARPKKLAIAGGKEEWEEFKV